ncbi:Proteophosphoglycan ppg4 [Rhodotorula toruloides ATCC 204091]|uniref:BY PROTMAP: gi/342321056/gb/EGU12994.1/ Proteophosphoglycan ppg4 [Rhodotorula glutinis ATCC 204091] n=1 Tax=Rhodotorula toruloides TaxID=5286 RepID=A0A0K3CF09_RHOTO|nr:Proteophosphoglycan ppg4 [Rhodotorula toruloides ATCC 204091]
MLARVPLDIVHLVIRHAVDRDAYDEDWPAYQQRLAQLCLICRFFRDAVQPLLWTTLRVRTLEQFHKVAGREGRNRHLVKHVEEFRGGPELTEERMDDAMIYLRHYLPSLQAISLSAFGLHEMGLERFLRFDNLRSLSLHKYNRLHPMPAGSILPSLETLSLARTAALLSTFCNILRPECTPRLRHLALTLFKSRAAPEPQACTTSSTSSRGPFRPAPPAYTELDDHVKYFLRAGILEQVKAVFLPSKLVNTDPFNDSTWRGAFLSLLRACRDNEIPIILYNADRDLSGELSTALMRHIERMDDSV